MRYRETSSERFFNVFFVIVLILTVFSLAYMFAAGDDICNTPFGRDDRRCFGYYTVQHRNGR